MSTGGVPGRSRLQRIAPDVLALLAVAAAGLAVLAPALVHGAGLYDTANADDMVDAIIPWTTLAWREVHQSVLPLWNPYNGVGVPLSFNWHSLTFSPPALIGYLLPLHMDFAAQIIITLLLAGSGMYIFGRVLGLGALPATFAAVTFELSGPFMGWLGLPVASVMAWAGWLFALGLLIVRQRHRTRTIIWFAVVLACTVFSSQPPLLAQLLIALAIFLFIVLVLNWRAQRDSVMTRGALRDLALATAAGLGLSAPLILPGLQLIPSSIQSLHNVTHLNQQVTPVGNVFYEYSNDAYLGVVCLVLAVVGLLVRRRRPEILGLGAVAALYAAASMVLPLVDLLHHVPVLGNADWSRVFLPMTFCVCVLSGFGLESAVQRSFGSRASTLLAGCFGALGVGVLLLWIVGSGHIYVLDAVARRKSLVWRGVESGTGVVVFGALALYFRYGPHRGSERRRSRLGVSAASVAACVLIACEGATLIVAGQSQWISANKRPMPWAENPAITAFETQVGTALVAFGENKDCFPNSLGILQNVNAADRVHELAIYDPIAPGEYLRAWSRATGQSAYVPWSIYCPAVTSAKMARRYGVRYILEPRGAPAPAGTKYAGFAGYSQYYFVPDSYKAVVVPLTPSGNLPGPDAIGAAAPVATGHDNAWTIDVAVTTASVLRLHLAGVPGWHATIDGRPLKLSRYEGIMLQARIPSGRHRVVVKYWPSTFSLGILLAVISAACLVLLPWMAGMRRRRRERGGADDSPEARRDATISDTPPERGAAWPASYGENRG